MLNLTVNESISPIIFQLAIGGLGGFFVGFLLRRILKVALIIVALVFSLIFLAYLDVIDVDYGGLSQLASSFINAVNPALDLLAPLLAHIPFILSFVICFIVGFRRN